jgi:hypothetical protein
VRHLNAKALRLAVTILVIVAQVKSTNNVTEN